MTSRPAGLSVLALPAGCAGLLQKWATIPFEGIVVRLERRVFRGVSDAKS